MANRNFQMGGSTAAYNFTAVGFIDDGSGAVVGIMSLIDAAGSGGPVTVQINGTVTGTTGAETIAFASIDTAKLDLSVSGSIGSAAGTITASVTGTYGGAISMIATGTANDRLVHHGTAQHDHDESGMTVLGGVSVNDPCALAQKLRAVRLELIAGQGIARTEVAGRSVYFTAGNLAALEKEIARLDSECAAASGTTLKPSTTPRTRRAIRFNPYL